MTAKKMPKNAEIFVCEKCNFTCSKKSNYEKHILTRKHQILTKKCRKMPSTFVRVENLTNIVKVCVIIKKNV